MGVNSYDPARPVIMAHLVAGYPDEAGAFAAAKGLASGGAAYLEIQFPFSDPSADGPVIQTACVASLAGGFRLKEGFAFVSRVVAELKLPVFIMSYASLVYAMGVGRFCDQARAAGALGLIIPDLCADEDEDLYRLGAQRGLAVVPVVAPGMSEERMARVLSLKTEYVYAALRAGITGKKTDIGADNLAFLEMAKSGGAKLLAGFGIRNREQILALADHVHAAIVGSAFTEAVAQASAPASAAALEDALRRKIQGLIA